MLTVKLIKISNRYYMKTIETCFNMLIALIINSLLNKKLYFFHVTTNNDNNSLKLI